MADTSQYSTEIAHVQRKIGLDGYIMSSDSSYKFLLSKTAAVHVSQFLASIAGKVKQV